MPKAKLHATIVENSKFEVHVLDPKSDRRDNVKVTIHGDDGSTAHHHLRTYEVMRLVQALNEALSFGPAIP